MTRIVPFHRPRAAAVLATAIAAAALALAALPARAAGRVQVSFTYPERYTDAGSGAVERDRAMSALSAYLQTLAQRLPEGRTLKVRFTDIDLAGRVDPSRPGHLRVVRGGADWPRLALRYELVEGDRTIKSGDERLADLDHPHSAPAGAGDRGELAHEKRMLRQWFDRTIAGSAR